MPCYSATLVLTCSSFLFLFVGQHSPKIFAPRKNRQITETIGDYWNSAGAKKLFAPNVGEAVELCLMRRIDLLKKMANNEDMLVERVNRGKEKDCELRNKDVIKMTHLCLCLSLAYLSMLESKNKNWVVSCNNAINKLNQIGITTIPCEKYIRKWNRVFQTNEKFPHPRAVLIALPYLIVFLMQKIKSTNGYLQMLRHLPPKI